MVRPTAYVHSPLPATQLDCLNPNSLNNGFYELTQRCLQSETKFSFVHAGSTRHNSNLGFINSRINKNLNKLELEKENQKPKHQHPQAQMASHWFSQAHSVSVTWISLSSFAISKVSDLGIFFVPNNAQMGHGITSNS